MAEIKVQLGWRDFPEIARGLDQIAHEQGCQRSDIIRSAVRDRIKRFAADENK